MVESLPKIKFNVLMRKDFCNDSKDGTTLFLTLCLGTRQYIIIIMGLAYCEIKRERRLRQLLVKKKKVSLHIRNSDSDTATYYRR